MLLKTVFQMLLKISKVGEKLKNVGIKMPYRRYEKTVLIEELVQSLIILLTSFAVCFVIHPFTAHFWMQFQCVVVKSWLNAL